MRFMRCVCWLALILALVGCGLDPDKQKQRFFDLGNKYFEQGDLDEASIFYRKALQYDRRFAEAYYKLGLVSLEQRAVQQAVYSFRRAFELDRDNLDAFRKLGDIYLTASMSPSPARNEAAIDSVLQLTALAEENHPTSKEVLYMKGRLRLAERSFDEALHFLVQARDLDPDDTGFSVAVVVSQYYSKKTEEAEQTALEFLSRNPDAPNMYNFLYQHYATSGRVEEAGEMLEKKAAALPDDPQNWISLAGFYRSRGNAERAEEVLLNLTDDPERFPNAWLTIGDFYNASRETKLAIEAYEKGLEQNPDQAESYRFRIVYAHVVNGDRATASRMIDEILEEDPEDARALGLRGAMRLHTGDQSQRSLALEDLRLAVASLPSNAALRYQYGRALMLTGDLHAAESQLQDAIRESPQFLPPHHSLLDLHLGQGKFSEAELVAEEILNVSPLDGSARLALAIAKMGLGQYEEARRNLMLMVEHKQRMADAVWQLGRLDLVEKKYAAAEARFSGLLKAEPPDPRGVQGLLDLYIVQNRLSDARALIAEEVRKTPEKSQLRVLAGRLALAASETDVAARELQAVLDREPENIAANQFMAEIAVSRGDNAAAKRHLEIAIKGQPPQATVFFRYGTLLATEGDLRAARTHLERCLELDPDHADALNNLAFVLADLGVDLGHAVTYSQRAVARAPENTDYADTLGYVYIKRRLYTNAVEVLEKVVKEQPQRGDYRYHLGLALFRAGQRSAARTELQAAKALQLNSADANGVQGLLDQMGG